jgi:hypothetical protein
VAAARHRDPDVTPNGLKKRPGDPQKSMKSTCCGLRGALDAPKGVSGYPPGCKNDSKSCFTYPSRTSQSTLRSCRSAGTRTRKVAMVSSPRTLISKDWRWCCPPRAHAKNWRGSRPSRQCFKKGRWPRPSCHLPRPADTTAPGLPLLTLSSARRLSEAHMDNSGDLLGISIEIRKSHEF